MNKDIATGLGKGSAPITRLRFVSFLLVLMFSIAAFQISSMQLTVFHMMNPDWEEVKVMLLEPGWVVVLSLSSFMIPTFLFLWPVLVFIRKKADGEDISLALARKVQTRGIGFPYFMAAAAFPFYMAGGYLGVWVLIEKLSWPDDLPLYGLVSGTISCFLASPMAIFAYHRVTDPVVQAAGRIDTTRPPARREGLGLSVRAKLMISIFTLSMGLSAYPMLIGYNQTNLVADRVEKMMDLGSGDLVELSTFVEERRGLENAIFISLLVVACLASLGLAALAAGEVTSPIGILKREAGRVARGARDRPIYLVTNDEFADLGESINAMVETIKDQVRTVERVAATLQHGIGTMEQTVDKILQVSAEQSTGATEQASAVQESSSIAEEIVASARQIAERAQIMDAAAASTLNACREGEGKLDEAAEGFSRISEQVNEVFESAKDLEQRFYEAYRIVELMEDMAEQLELLALNASLEAAGAGLAGKRFQIVAQATRGLAQRSGEAVSEIRFLVRAIQESTFRTVKTTEDGRDKVTKGGAAIGEAVSALKNIINFAGSTSRAVREITMSTEQQTSASEQLAASVSQVNEVALRVEEGAREVVAAIVELQTFSQSLRGEVETIERG